jgi:serine/threonine-protein kinase RsbW
MPEQPPDVADSDAMSYADPGDLKAVRAFVAARASAFGLPAGRVDLLTVAISELATNTLQHTAGGGRVRVWADAGQLICDVVDGGPLRSFGRQMPAADAVRGRGLALVERVCDVVDVSAVAEGTLVRLRLNL